MEPAEQKQILDRLARVEGQVRGLRKMLEEDRDCEEILTQLLAARSGLEGASMRILDHHLRDCVLVGEPIRPESLDALRKTLQLWNRHGAGA